MFAHKEGSSPRSNLHILYNCFFSAFLSSLVKQRASEQEEGEGYSEGVYATVQRSPWYRVRR